MVAPAGLTTMTAQDPAPPPPAATPLPGHTPWYEIQTYLAGRNADGWPDHRPTGQARGGCTCGLVMGWGDTAEVLGQLRATCYTPSPTPPSPAT